MLKLRGFVNMELHYGTVKTHRVYAVELRLRAHAVALRHRGNAVINICRGGRHFDCFRKERVFENNGFRVTYNKAPRVA